jgi:quinol monooxygenase YgiN
MVGLEILITIQPEKRVEFLQAFELFTQPNPNTCDCIEQTLFEKIGEPNAFLWQEDWKNDESLEARRQTEQFKSLLGAVEILGTLVMIRKFTLTKE